MTDAGRALPDVVRGLPSESAGNTALASGMLSPAPTIVHAPSCLLRGGWVLPVCAPPVESGAVRVVAGRIAAVGPARELPPLPGERVLDFPECVLLPGLVNAHCHLELGGMHGRVPSTGSLPQWLAGLMAHGLPDADAVDAAVCDGARLLLAGGCTAVGDITTTGLAREPLARSGLRAVSFRELLGLTPERAEAALEVARGWLASAPAGTRVAAGLSPHAPYSTGATVYAEAACLARDAGAPFTTHLSESLDEVRFLRDGSGAYADLLAARGIRAEAWRAPGVSPVCYLARLGILGLQGAGAHVNYLLPGDLELLSGGRMVPVYCPGSHAFFGHPTHPAGEMLRAGLPVALGTDSLASNESLDMLREARLAWERVPGTTAADWVRAATLSGARALRLEGVCGALAPGLQADLIAVRPGQAAADPCEAVLAPGSRVALAMVGGDALVAVE